MKEKATIATAADVDRMLTRIAHQIIEKNHGINGLCLIGIRTRGVPLACRIAEKISAIEGSSVPVGALDITWYRDDLSVVAEAPQLGKSEIPFSVEGMTVVLVDDVIYTGRTARAALDAVISLGRPGRIQLCVLVDRGHTELPIRPNFVGKNIPTSHEEIVAVHLSECDGDDKICILEKNRTIPMQGK